MKAKAIAALMPRNLPVTRRSHHDGWLRPWARNSFGSSVALFLSAGARLARGPKTVDPEQRLNCCQP